MKSELVDLILSLTPSERREFKVKNGQENDYVIILDYVVKNKSANYSELKRYFEENFPTRTTKFTSGYFSSITNYLQQKILDITIQNDRKHPIIAYAHHFQRAQSLYLRGIYGLAFQELGTCKAIAEKHQLLEEQLLINRQFRSVHSTDFYAKLDLAGFNELSQQYSNLKAELSSQHSYSELAAKSIICFYREQNDENFFAQLRSIPDHEPQIDNTWTILFRHISNAKKHLLNEEIEVGIEVFKQSVDFIIANRPMIAVNGMIFMSTVQFYFNCLIRFSTREKDFTPQIKALFQTLETESKNFSAGNELNTSRELLHIMEFWLLRNTGDYAKVIKKLEIDVTAEYTTEHNRIHLVFNVAFAYFQLGLYDKTIDLIDPIVEGNYDFRSNNYVYVQMMMLRILTYHEKGNSTFVLYLIRNAEYLFSKHGFKFNYEKSFLNLMKKTLNKRFSLKKQDFFNEFRTDYAKIKYNSPDYLRLEEWMERQ